MPSQTVARTCTAPPIVVQMTEYLARKNRKRDKYNTPPHLPKELIKDLLAQPAAAGLHSCVFDEYMRRFRIDVVNVNAEERLSPDMVPVSDAAMGSVNLFTGGGGSLLHQSVSLSDHILALEMIRLGASIDKRDDKGRTPLFLALETWRNTTVSLRGPTPPFDQNPDAYYERLRYIIKTLLEQHADPNLVVDGTTGLHSACAIGDWDLMAILLQFGAKASPPRDSSMAASLPVTLLPARDHIRFRRLAATYYNKPRPERLCPCFSGEVLAACHGKWSGLPYPPHFRCLCGSGRSFASCSCSRRDHRLQVAEYYGSTSQRIEGRFNRHMTIQPFRLTAEDLTASRNDAFMQGILEEMAVIMDLELIDHPDARIRFLSGVEKVRRMSTELVAKGLVDPAFSYALHKLDWYPRPQARAMDKRSLKAKQAKWNAIIDEYIDSGCDTRPRIEIERAAKIGLSLGALHLKCKQCSKMQGEEILDLRSCSKCKLAVYCSRACQTDDWPQHKKQCGGHRIREQSLPSQDMLLRTVRNRFVEKYDEAAASMSPQEYEAKLVFVSMSFVAKYIECFRRDIPVSDELIRFADSFSESMGRLRIGMDRFPAEYKPAPKPGSAMYFFGLCFLFMYDK